MNTLRDMINNFKAWKKKRDFKNFVSKDYDKRVIRKESCVDHNMGAGYYIKGVQMLFSTQSIEELNSKVELKMQSSKIGLFKLLDYKLFSDPSDMVKESTWQFLGYKGEKLIADMSRDEYLEFVTKNYKGDE